MPEPTQSEVGSPAALGQERASSGTGRSGTEPEAFLGRWLFVRRGWLPWLVLPLLVFSSRYEVELGGRGVLIAGFWIAFGEALRIWAVGYAGSRTRTRAPNRSIGELVTSGPYAYVRNPIYLGNCLQALGIVLLFEQWLMAPLLLLGVFLIYQPVVRWEEQRLAMTFGEEYRRYHRAVPRWIPRVRRYLFASDHRFSWRQALRSERGTIGTLLLLCLIHGIEEWVEIALR